LPKVRLRNEHFLVKSSFLHFHLEKTLNVKTSSMAIDDYWKLATILPIRLSVCGL